MWGRISGVTQVHAWRKAEEDLYEVQKIPFVRRYCYVVWTVAIGRCCVCEVKAVCSVV